ncbi:MAG: (deoxy)nucleoside triphosphate pyrophosphohydrolase [Thermodesulfobacteriota bacterium]
MAPATRNHLQVTAAVIRKGEKVLLARRGPGGRHAGCWEFPGGKQEPGETLEETLAREVREELGLDVCVGRLFTRVDHDYGDFSLTLHAFLCPPPPGTDPVRGREDLCWAGPEDFETFDLLPPDRVIARRLKQDWERTVKERE